MEPAPKAGKEAMFIKQFYLGCLAHASYLIVDERTGRAAVIDPQRDVDQYLEEAQARGATIDRVLLTHFHADFIAGHLELRERTGAAIHLGARAEAEYEYTPLKDGDVLDFGDVRLEILETPGHTPEAISIVAKDTSKGDAPVAVFTGDTLFVGDVGRPDLLASEGVTADELAGWLYESLHGKLMPLPDATTVYPAHGAGSLCGKNLGSETFSTIGEQRRANYALQPMSKGAFQALMTAEQPATPGYFAHDAALNKRNRKLLSDSLAESLVPLTQDEVIRLQASGAVVLDVRAPEHFAEGHLPGSYNVGLDGKFATWAGSVLSPDARVVLVADAGREREAAMRLGRIGLDDVAGYLDGGSASLGDALATLVGVDVRAALEERGENTLILDVRNPGERGNGHIEASMHIPLGALVARAGEVPKDRRVAVVCRSGYRSSVAASILMAHGVRDVRNVLGGMLAWEDAGLPVHVPDLAAGAGSSGESCGA